MTNLGEAFDSW